MNNFQNLKNDEQTQHSEKESAVRHCNQPQSYRKKIVKLFQFIVATFFQISLAFILNKLRQSNLDCDLNNQHECARFLNSLFFKNVNVYMLAGINFSLIFMLSIQKFLNKYQGLATLGVLVFVVFLYDNEVSSVHFGGVFTKLIGLFAVTMLLLLCILMQIAYFFRKSAIKTVLVFLIIFGLSRNYVLESCRDWDKGLGGRRLNQSRQYCKVKEPKICLYTLFESYINLSPLIIGSCENQFESRESYYKYFTEIDKTQRYLGLLNTNEIQQSSRTAANIQIQQQIFNKSKAYDSLQEVFGSGQEIAIDLQKMVYHYQITRNEKLVQERQTQKQFIPYSKNILTIFIDGLSRNAFGRHLPQTLAWLHNREQNSNSKTLEFFRFASLVPYTFPNYQRFYYEIAALHLQDQVFRTNPSIRFPCEQGEIVQWLPENEEEADNIDISWRKKSNLIDLMAYPQDCAKLHAQFDDPKKYIPLGKPQNSFRKIQGNILGPASSAGMITGRATNMCYPNAGGYVLATQPSKYYEQVPDHEGLAFACDPHYHEPLDTFGWLEGPFSLVQRCLNGKNLNEHALDYAREFYRQYRGDSTFMNLEFIDCHEPTASVIKYLDQPISKFLIEMENNGSLDDTLIVFFSDHGQHNHIFMGFFESQQFDTERMLPVLLMSTPKGFHTKYPELQRDLQYSEQKLFTNANLHFFLQTWLRGGDYEHQDKSFFNRDYPSNHFCEDAITNLEQTVLTYSYDRICVCTKQFN